MIEREGTAWRLLLRLGAHEVQFDGKVTPCGVVMHPISHLATAPILARCLEALARAELGPVHTTLDLEAPAHLVDALEGVGFVPGARRITFRRSLLGFKPIRSAFELVPLADHLGEAAPVVKDVCRDMPLLQGASAEECLDHLVALAGGRMGAGWTLARRDGRSVGLFAPEVEEGRGELLAFGLADWARGRGWGRALHLSALGVLKDLGARVYEDGTEVGNLPMRSIFRANGCGATGDYEDWVWGVEPREHTVGWVGESAPLPDAPFWADARVDASLSARPALCAALARVAFSFLLDRASAIGSDPLWIVDVQPNTLARTVRMLTELKRLCAQHPEPLPPWRFIVWGPPPSLSREWTRDRRTRAWVESGLLDWIEPPPASGAVQELAMSKARIHENRGIFAVVAEHACYLPQHGFRVDGQELRELQVHPDPEATGMWQVRAGDHLVDELPETMEELGLDLVFADYRSSAFRDVLVPTGAATLVDALLRWGGGPSMVVSVEPGTLSAEEMQGRTLGPIQAAGAPRLPLDHHALRRALETLGVRGLLAEGGDGDTVVAAWSRGEIRDLAHAVRTWRVEFEGRCPVVRNWPMADPKVVEEVGVESLLAQLRLSGHDPEVFLALVPRLRELVSAITDIQRSRLLRTLEKVCANLVGEPFDGDAAFSAGRLAYDLRDADLAWLAFSAAAQLGGLTVSTILNLGLVARAEGRTDLARAQFEAVLALQPGEEAASRLLGDLEDEAAGR